MTCIECGSKSMILKNKAYVANLDNCIIIIKNVPTLECENCGELYYDDEVVQRIEAIVSKLKDIINDIAIIDYAKNVA